MPLYTAGVQGYSNIPQRTGIVIETGSAPGESLLLASTLIAGTMSLTTQPNTISATTGMHLHCYIIGNTTTGTIAFTGTGPSGALSSITYHVPVAPQNGAGFTEITTKEAFLTVTASNIATTGMTGGSLIIYGTFAAKYLIPINLDKEEKITKHAPEDKRGILFKNLRVVQLTKAVDIAKLDADLYPTSSLAFPYMAFGNTPTITTVPSAGTSLLASTAIAATMTLTTPPTAPGQFLIFAITTNTLSGTIVVNGTDQFGNAYASSETITFSSAASQTVYSARRYSVVNTSGANTFTTTGGTSAHIAVTGVYGWQFAWTVDGLNNVTPYSGALQSYDGVYGVVLPGVVLSDLGFEYSKEKQITLTSKGGAQDYLIVGDPNTTTFGTNPFTTLSQPSDNPYTSWPASFYIDNDNGGTALTTQDGSLLTYKFNYMTGRKWNYAGDSQQRPAYVTWDSAPDFTVDAEIIDIGYANYNTYFKPNVPMILGTTFQGAFLGNISNTSYFEQVQIITPVKVDTWKQDQTKNPVQGSLKLMASYDFANLGYGFKVIWICQQPPVFTS